MEGNILAEMRNDIYEMLCNILSCIAFPFEKAQLNSFLSETMKTKLWEGELVSKNVNFDEEKEKVRKIETFFFESYKETLMVDCMTVIIVFEIKVVGSNEKNYELRNIEPLIKLLEKSDNKLILKNGLRILRKICQKFSSHIREYSLRDKTTKFLIKT